MIVDLDDGDRMIIMLTLMEAYDRQPVHPVVDARDGVKNELLRKAINKLSRVNTSEEWNPSDLPRRILDELLGKRVGESE